jgi:hypothetical protein
MASFNDFWKELTKELSEFADYSWSTFKKAAVSDGKAFLDQSKEDLKRWTVLLADGKLTPDDFEWLVAGKRDLAELVALKQAGLTKVALDRFSNGLVDTIVSTAFKVFL